MNKIPDVPMDIWDSLYHAALQFRKAAAWDHMDDTQLFGLRDAGTGETGYACVLGAAGEMFGLCVYRGARGFDVHRRIMRQELSPDSDDLFTAQDCLMASFGESRYLEAADRALLKKLGLKPRGSNAWPLFRAYAPGYVPWMVTAEEALFLTEALLCGLHVSNGIIDDELDLAARPGEVLVHALSDDGTFSSAWEPHPVRRPEPLAPIPLDAERVSRARAAAVRRDGTWEVGSFLLPLPVGDADRPYYPRLAMTVHRSSGMILPTKMTDPQAPPYRLVADALVEAVETTKVLPNAVAVADERLAEALAPLARALGVEVRAEKRLRTFDRARREMTEAMRARR